MKLVDFKNDDSFNYLRKKMKAQYIKWNGVSNWTSFDPFDFRTSFLEKGEVDIPFSQIKVSEDNSLELFGEKILVYIRDQRGNYFSTYKFHISNCSTLIDARKNNKYNKYVASVNTSNKFMVNIIHSENWIEENIEVQMNVCKNCLSKLNYKGYKNRNMKDQVYNNFNLEEFFSLYKNQSILKPKHTNITAPLNNYTSDWDEISNNIKNTVNYKCQKCFIDLSNYTKYLHVHHKDGIKSNNRSSNLIPLCIECHSNEPEHGQLKAHPDLHKFKIIKPQIIQKNQLLF